MTWVLNKIFHFTCHHKSWRGIALGCSYRNASYEKNPKFRSCSGSHLCWLNLKHREWSVNNDCHADCFKNWNTSCCSTHPWKPNSKWLCVCYATFERKFCKMFWWKRNNYFFHILKFKLTWLIMIIIVLWQHTHTLYIFLLLLVSSSLSHRRFSCRKTCFKNVVAFCTATFLCHFHVAQLEWRWLHGQKNMQLDEKKRLMKLFQSVS